MSARVELPIASAGSIEGQAWADQCDEIGLEASSFDSAHSSTHTHGAGLMSLGSRFHDSGRCKPCAFFHRKEGCNSGRECAFCHLCPPNEKARRKRVSRQICQRLQKGSFSGDSLGGSVGSSGGCSPQSSLSTAATSRSLGHSRQNSTGSSFQGFRQSAGHSRQNSSVTSVGGSDMCASQAARSTPRTGNHQIAEAQHQQHLEVRNAAAPQSGTMHSQMMPMVAIVQPQTAASYQFGAAQEQSRPRSASNASGGALHGPEAQRPSSTFTTPMMQQHMPAPVPVFAPVPQAQPSFFQVPVQMIALGQFQQQFIPFNTATPNTSSTGLSARAVYHTPGAVAPVPFHAEAVAHQPDAVYRHELMPVSEASPLELSRSSSESSLSSVGS